MQFLTSAECEQWLSDRDRVRPTLSSCSLPPGGRVGEGGEFTARIGFPNKAHRLQWFARQIATQLASGAPCLMWLDEWGIWNENLHLYYRLRESYGDRRLLEVAPGHLCLGYETEDLATMLQVAKLNGWGGYLLTHLDYVNAFVSHDEYIDLFSNDQSLIESLKADLT
jgi:hypothetical protein